MTSIEHLFLALFILVFAGSLWLHLSRKSNKKNTVVKCMRCVKEPHEYKEADDCKHLTSTFGNEN